MSSAPAAAGLGIGDLFTHAFMVNAFVAGIPIAALAGVIGYVMVLRSQVFTGDALSHVAFTGALCALAAGIDLRLGLFAATLAVAAVLGLIGDRGRADDVVIGTVFAWILGIGVLALSVYAAGSHAATEGAAGVSVLFGSIFGISSTTAAVAAAIAVALLALTVLLARPLVFASIDEAVAAARGVPVRALGTVFLLIVGATAAEATQAVGALLMLGLLAAPAGAASRLTGRPFRAMALASALAVAAMVGGLLLAYLVPQLPPSFTILAVAALVLAATYVRPAGRGRPTITAARQPGPEHG